MGDDFRNPEWTCIVGRWLPGLCMLLLALAYGALTLVVLPQTAFFSGDEGMKAIQVQNLIRQGWTSVAIEYPGRSLDPAGQFFPIPGRFTFVRNGAFYFMYPLAFSLLASGAYAWLGYAGLYLIPVGAGLISLFLTYRLARLSLNPAQATLALLLLALATPFSFYCLVFWEHTLATALCSLALLLLIAPPTRRPWQPLIGGICLGAMVSFRTEGYALALAVVAAWAVVYRRGIGLVLILVGLTLALVPLWASNQALYDTPLGLHLAAHSDALPGPGDGYTWLVGRLMVAEDIITQGSLDKYVDFAFGLTMLAAGVTLAVPRLRRNRVVVGVSLLALVLLGLANVVGAEQTVIRGLLPACPLVSLALVYAWVRVERTTEDFFVLTFLGSLILVTLTTPVDTGLHWGPRFLLPTLPLVVILAVRFLVTPKASWGQTLRDRSVVRLAGALLVLLGVIVQVQGLRLLAREKAGSAQLVGYFHSLPTQYIISEVDWFAAEAASLFYQRTFFYVADQAGYEELVARFHAHGVDGFALLPLAASHIQPQIRTDRYAVEATQQFQFRIVPYGDNQGR